MLWRGGGGAGETLNVLCHARLSRLPPPLAQEMSGSAKGLVYGMYGPEELHGPPFVQKLRYVLDDERFVTMLRWTPDGRGVLINEHAHTTGQLVQCGASETTNTKSLRRQFNLHGFSYVKIKGENLALLRADEPPQFWKLAQQPLFVRDDADHRMQRCIWMKKRRGRRIRASRARLVPTHVPDCGPAVPQKVPNAAQAPGDRVSVVPSSDEGVCVRKYKRVRTASHGKHLQSAPGLLVQRTCPACRASTSPCLLTSYTHAWHIVALLCRCAARTPKHSRQRRCARCRRADPGPLCGGHPANGRGWVPTVAR